MKIGFVVSLSDARGEGPGSADRYTTVRDRAMRAEDAGYDSIWLYDHLFFRPDQFVGTVGIWEGWTMMSALAEATNRVEIGSLVACNQFRNPAILAKMAHTLDEVSAGRLVLGIGAGWQKAEFDAFGIPFDHRVSRLDEALQIIRPLLSYGEVDFEGEYYSARDCQISPMGPRVGGPPLMVGAFGPRTMRLAARYGDIWNTAYWATPADAADQMAMWAEAVADVQPDPEPPKTILTRVSFDDLFGGESPFPSSITGSAEEIAAAINAHAASGISHLQLHIEPYTDEAITRVEAAVSLWRDQSQ